MGHMAYVRRLEVLRRRYCFDCACPPCSAAHAAAVADDVSSSLAAMGPLPVLAPAPWNTAIAPRAAAAAAASEAVEPPAEAAGVGAGGDGKGRGGKGKGSKGKGGEGNGGKGKGGNGKGGKGKGKGGNGKGGKGSKVATTARHSGQERKRPAAGEGRPEVASGGGFTDLAEAKALYREAMQLLAPDDAAAAAAAAGAGVGAKAQRLQRLQRAVDALRACLVRLLRCEAAADDDRVRAAVSLKVGATHDALARGWSELGDFGQAADHCAASLRLLRRRLGAADPALAMELLKLAQLRFNAAAGPPPAPVRDGQSASRRQPEQRGQRARAAEAAVEEALRALAPHVPPGHPALRELSRMQRLLGR